MLLRRCQYDAVSAKTEYPRLDLEGQLVGLMVGAVGYATQVMPADDPHLQRSSAVHVTTAQMVKSAVAMPSWYTSWD